MTPWPQGWRRQAAVDAHEEFIVALIEERKDLTLDEMVIPPVINGLQK